MGIKQRNFVYISDGGQEFELDDMTPSHLLNAIGHHRRQLDTVKFVLENFDFPNHALCVRAEALEQTIRALAEELYTRHPTDDYNDNDY